MKKRSKIILSVLILSMITLVFSGCGGGGTIPPINHSPTITSLTANPQSPIEINQNTVITCSVSDPDGDSLTYTWTKTGGVITGTGSAITWIAPDIEGTYIITCIVSDGELTDEQSIYIDVEQELPPDTAEPELIEAVSVEIDLEEGGVIEVTDPESIINGVKLIIPSISSEKRGGKSIATITISYLNDPYSLKLPDNRGFLLPPVVINSDVILEVECILKIPYTEADLSNMGLSSNENIKVYRYNYNSSSWEEIPINKRSFKDISDILETIFRPEDIDSPYACTFKNADPPSDLGLPQSGDLLYKLSNYKGIEGWIPGHVGIYVGEHEKDSEGDPYNVIEALLSGGVQRNYYNPISDFSDSATYMGARQPKSGILNPGQRKVIVAWAETIAELELPCAIGQSFPGIFIGMLQGDMVKGELGSYNCVGLAEKAYEIVGVNGGQGLVSDLDEGNYCPISQYSSSCVLTPAEQYNKTTPAEGYTVSGRVTDAQGNGIPGVTLNFELVSFNNYHNSFEVTTNSGGYWSSDKLGREWNVTPQKDGYTFEPSTLHEGWEKSVPSTWIVKGNANDIDFTGMSDELQNHAPVITSTAVTSATKDELYSYDVNATDADGDTLTYSLITSPSGMTINFATGLIAWIPTATGSFGVTVKVSDGELFDTQSFTVAVEENCTSLGQVQLISPSNGATLPPGGITFSWNPVSNATKYQFILYNSLGQVALDAIDSGTSSIVGLDIEETITWKIRAGDNSGNWGAWSSTWSLTIKSTTPVNHAPVITSTAVTSATKDELYSYDVNATDADGDTLVYSLTTKPSGMSINSSTGQIAWIPASTGVYNVTVKVSDGELFDTQSFTVAVSESQQQITPGGMAYMWYDWPQLPVSGFYNFDVLLTIDVDPGVQSSYYWAHQFGFKNGDGGYMGLQTNGHMQGEWVGKMAIFSIWDALEAEPGPGASSEEFTGEGEGWSCRKKYNWVEGHTYCLRVEACGIDEQENEWWGAWIIDTSTEQETLIGKIKVPVSWQGLEDYSVVWVEYYGQVNGCNSIPYAKARFEQPTADNSSIIPQNLTSDLGTTCPNASISFLEDQGVLFETGGSL